MANRTDLRSLHESAIETLANETQMPRDVVANLYRAELSNLESGASIKQFLPLIVSRRVIQRLRVHRKIH
jgi:Protein of unknown function (DUF3562)